MPLLRVQTSENSQNNIKSASQEPSQDLDISVVQGLMETHRKSVKTRRRERETAIRNADKQRYAGIQKKLEKAVEGYESRLRAEQGPKIKRLKELRVRSRQLHEAVKNCIAEIEKAADTTVEHLSMAMNNRGVELRGEGEA